MPAVPDLTLPNAGPGPDVVSLPALCADDGAVAVLLLRGPRSGPCRRQVQRIAARRDAVSERDGTVVAVLPASHEAAAAWAVDLEVPFPVAADPGGRLGAELGQPVRLGAIVRWFPVLERRSPFLGRLPAAAVVACRPEPTVAWTYRGRSAYDRPDEEDLLAALEGAA